MTPVQRFFDFLWHNRHDIAALTLFNAVSGLFSLAIPLSVQALIAIIATGFALRELILLSATILIVLLVVAGLRLLQLRLTELLQQRLMAQVATRLGGQLIRVPHPVWRETYAPDLINRFFEIVKLQKALSKILSDAPQAVLQILFGLVLMAIYSPFLFSFDLFLILMGVAIAWLGRGAVATALEESNQKYQLARLLEELGRCHISLKMNGLPAYFTRKIDGEVVHYLYARRRHFAIWLRQLFGSYLLQAVAMTLVLGLGGWLVVQRQMTLGQLVAAELVIVILLGAIEKLASGLADLYDLLVSFEKLGYLLDLPVEEYRGHHPPRLPQGAKVVCQNVTYRYPEEQVVLEHLDLTVTPGERTAIVGRSGAGTSTLGYLLCGLLPLQQGRILFNDIDIDLLDLKALRSEIALVTAHNEIFHGTVEENITLGRIVSAQQLQRALRLADMEEMLARLPRGLETELLAEGINISEGERIRIQIARALLGEPQLLILDDIFYGLEEAGKRRVVENLLDPVHRWTVIFIGHDPDVVIRCERIHVLEGGKIVESGTLQELVHLDGVFVKLFPDLSSALRRHPLAL